MADVAILEIDMRTLLTVFVLCGLICPSTDAKPLKKTKSVAPKSIAMVVAAEPDAAKAGMIVLKKGGTALDASVAVMATLGLVEPQSSGIGGGAFLLYFDAKSGQTRFYDGREIAPKSAKPDDFLKADQTPLSYADATASGRATGVPSVMAMLELAHHHHGKLAWNTLFSEPIRLAEEGFIIPKRLGYNLETRPFPAKSSADFQAHFAAPNAPKGTLKRTGDLHINTAYAATLKLIAKDGAKALTEGAIAQEIVQKVQSAPLPSALNQDDLRAYRPLERVPLCVTYRVLYKVCSGAPPSGGLALLQGLKIIEQFPLSKWGKKDARSWQVLIEAERLLYADRDHYLADPDHVRVPVNGLLDPAYIKDRAATIRINTPSPAPSFGMPSGLVAYGPDATHEQSGTTHFVVIDEAGNVASITATVEYIFGTGRMAGGFFLNNQLTDFSLKPLNKDQSPAANAVGPHKRPRSSMSPVMVFDQKGRLIATFGSPGGSNILSYNLKTLVGLLDFKLPIQEAIDLGHVVARGENIRLEVDKIPEPAIKGLRDMGYSYKEMQDEESGLNGAQLVSHYGYVGGADKRRNGVTLYLKDTPK